MLRPHPETIAFLAPGLVHQFGNLLLTVQGQALVLDPANTSMLRARHSILGACSRGATTLRLLRALLGENDGSYDSGPSLLEALVELLRVPVREAGLRLDVAPADGEPFLVPTTGFTWATVELVRALVAVLPKGDAGRLWLSAHVDGDRAIVACEFRAAADRLPFPLPIAAAQDQLAACLAATAAAGAVSPMAAGLQVATPAQRVRGEACSDLHRSLPEST